MWTFDTEQRKIKIMEEKFEFNSELDNKIVRLNILCVLFEIRSSQQ